MTAEQSQLLSLIADYQAAVAQAAAWLNARAKEQPGFQRQQEQPGCYAGYLDEARQIRYALHGGGCLVAGPEFKVNFDFAYTTRCDGIDDRLLSGFLRSNVDIKQKYALLTSAGQLKQLLQELEKAGVLSRNVDTLAEHLYHLAADRHNTNPPTVTLYGTDESFDE